MWRPADGETLARVRAALQRAISRDRDPVAALDQLGLLRTPWREAEIRAEAVRDAADVIAAATLKQMTPTGGRQPATPLDAQRVIEQFLHSYAATLEPGRDG